MVMRVERDASSRNGIREKCKLGGVCSNGDFINECKGSARRCLTVHELMHVVA